MKIAMAAILTTPKTQTEILHTVFDLTARGLNKPLALGLLDLRFPTKDVTRMDVILRIFRTRLVHGLRLAGLVGVALLLAATSGIAADSVTVATLRQLMAAFNRHDLNAIMSFFADDCALEMPRGPEPWGQRYVGKSEVRKGLASRFEGLPDVHYSDDRHFVAGDRGASEWTLTGTTRDGRKIQVRGCDLFQFRDGKIARKDSYWKIIEPRQ
jgi:steroid delta-isomerase-like uncharacterized protein